MQLNSPALTAEQRANGVPEDALGHIEFEYWAENLVDYTNLIWYVAAGAVGLAAFICLCMNLCYYSSMSENV